MSKNNTLLIIGIVILVMASALLALKGIPLSKLADEGEKSACLNADTKITLVDGSSVGMDRLRIGARVLAVDIIDDETGEYRLTSAIVKKVVVHRGVYDMYIIKLDNGKKLEVTANHPVYVVGKGYVAAYEVWAGAKVSLSSGAGLDSGTVTAVVKASSGGNTRTQGSSERVVYDIQTTTPNNYFANSVLVHTSE